MQQHAEAAGAAGPAQHAGHLGDHLRALVGVGGVDVEKMRAASERLDAGHDALGAGQRRPPVEMHAEDVEPGARQREGGGAAEAGGSAEDERPAGETNGSGVGHASPGILAQRTRSAVKRMRARRARLRLPPGGSLGSPV